MLPCLQLAPPAARVLCADCEHFPNPPSHRQTRQQTTTLWGDDKKKAAKAPTNNWVSPAPTPHAAQWVVYTQTLGEEGAGGG